jgi:UDPglucose 6-dehydrogenase
MQLGVIGCGYVGLVTAACLADFGHTVICVDKDAARVEALRAGKVPIYEPGLSELVVENAAAGRLRFSTSMDDAVAASAAVFIAVGTPSRPEDGLADMSYVHGAAREIAAALRGFTVVINKSTVPIGSGDEVERIIRAANPAADFAVASNPEFLREGNAIADFREPDRVIIGTDDARAREVMADIYRPLGIDSSRLLFMGRRTAEITKYAANAFLVTKISFINEFADLCEKTGANVEDVARGIGLDSRIGPKFLNVGPGYGGSCFPKDTSALLRSAASMGAPLSIVGASVDANESRKLRMAQKIADAAGGSLKGKTVAVLGLAFKANTDDMRGAPSLAIVEALERAGARVKAFDPASMEQARPLLPSIEYCPDVYSCADGADILAILTEWPEFRALDLARLKELLQTPAIVDLRNLLSPDSVRRAGFAYSSIGRP